MKGNNFKLLGSLVMVAAGVILSLSIKPAEMTRAGSNIVTTEWRATKLLSIDTHPEDNGLWGQLGRNKRYFAIGPGEWSVKYYEGEGASKKLVYEEIWSLPQPPSCYKYAGEPNNPCGLGGESVTKYLWSLAWETTSDVTPAQWSFVFLAPDDPELFKMNNDRAYGQGSIGGLNNNNIHAIITNGVYGWFHGRFDEADRGGVVTGGSMIPLQWNVRGEFK